jgi:hypothetical protein
MAMARSCWALLAPVLFFSLACESDPPPPPPPAPLPGEQIDRIGRPGVNTALNNTFEGDPAVASAAKDEWNQNADRSTWVSSYATEVGKNLAIYDGLDTNCGNQLFADTSKTDASRYATLASVLADDRLWVKADATSCTIYLGVEANATMLGPNRDCGGRRPHYEVIKLTYSALAAGTLPASGALAAEVGVSDGTVPVAEKTTVATFPFLAPPQ